MKAAEIFDLRRILRFALQERLRSLRILRIGPAALLAASLAGCAGMQNAGADFSATTEAAETHQSDLKPSKISEPASKPIDEKLAAKALALTRANACTPTESMPDIGALALRAQTAPATTRQEAVSPVENEARLSQARLSQDEVISRLNALSSEARMGKGAASATRQSASEADLAESAISRDELLQRLGVLSAMTRTKARAPAVAQVWTTAGLAPPVAASPGAAATPRSTVAAPAHANVTRAPQSLPSAQRALAPALVKLRPETK